MPELDATPSTGTITAVPTSVAVLGVLSQISSIKSAASVRRALHAKPPFNSSFLNRACDPCGIVPEPQKFVLAKMNDPAEDADLKLLRDVSHSSVITCSGGKVFTDGSANYVKHHNLAHAGWGVVIVDSTGGIVERCRPVCGVVQTSYRAELRALLEVLAFCRGDFLVYCGWKAIVEAVQIFSKVGRHIHGAADEWWQLAYDLIETHHRGHIDIH